MEESCSVKIDEGTALKIKDFYQSYQVENSSPYLFFYAKMDSLQVFIYHSQHGYKAHFRGKNSLSELRLFVKDATLNEKKEVIKTEFIYFDDQIGSDEVGNGDFFGPFVVAACYLSKANFHYLNEYHIDDSKKMKDEEILEIVPKLKVVIPHSIMIVEPSKYNELINKGYNLNSIKAILHNQALYNVANKVKNRVPFFIDQFCDEGLYFHYLKGQKNIIRNITFKTKGESYYPCIALASMFARYRFLKEFEVLKAKYKMEFPKGASVKVDEFGKKFILKYGLNEFESICKKSYKNYQKIQALLESKY